MELLLPDGRSVGVAIADATPQLIPRVLARLVERLPAYGAMPVEQLTGDVVLIIDRTLRGLVDALETDGTPTADLLALAKDSALRRGEEGIPMEAIMDAYLLGMKEGVDYLRPLLTGSDVATMLRLTEGLLTFQEQLQQAVAAGYMEQRESVVGEAQAVRSTLLSALLDGSDPSGAAQRAGVRLPSAFAVLAVGFAPHPDEIAGGVDHTVAARRKVRRIRFEIERGDPDRTLSALSPQGGTVLVPVRNSDPVDWSTVHQRLTTASGADVMVVVEIVTPDSVPDGVRLTHEVLEVVQKTGRPPGAYRLVDVLLDYQITRPGPARDRLAAALDPVTDDLLLGTLTTYLASGLRRRSTASLLHVHPNTVDNRLRRVAVLTGLDPTRQQDLPALRAAVAARQMAAGS